MKRKKAYKKETTAALHAKLAMYQHIMGAMLVRLGGEIELPSQELDTMEGKRVEFNATPRGVWMKTEMPLTSSPLIITPPGYGG